MNANEFRFGFRALSRDGERKLTDGRTAFRAHVEADPRAMTEGECYLSHMMFPDEFRTHLATTGSTAGYTGPTWLQWLVLISTLRALSWATVTENFFQRRRTWRNSLRWMNWHSHC